MIVGVKIRGALTRSYKAGARIAFGTDMGVGPHGQNAREFTYMVEAGMPSREAIKAATVNAAKLFDLSDEVWNCRVRQIGGFDRCGFEPARQSVCTRTGGLCHGPRRCLSGVTWFPPLPARIACGKVSVEPRPSGGAPLTPVRYPCFLFLAQGKGRLAAPQFPAFQINIDWPLKGRGHRDPRPASVIRC